jgi:hypothetical protein
MATLSTWHAPLHPAPLPHQSGLPDRTGCGVRHSSGARQAATRVLASQKEPAHHTLEWATVLAAFESPEHKPLVSFRHPGCSPLSRFIAHFLIRLLIVMQLPQQLQVASVLFPERLVPGLALPHLAWVVGRGPAVAAPLAVAAWPGRA